MTISPTTDINKPFPRSILSVSRDEFGLKIDNPNAKYPPLKLIVKDGELPLDIQGHVFIVGTVGSWNSKHCSGTEVVYPSSDGFTPMYNGDGAIYRFDFDKPQEGVSLTTRIAKAPCYYADIAASQLAPNCRFENRGITRLSEKLGVRNQLNTAFLPMKFSEQESDRLLLTWDIGRPYEIDPQTLELVTPVGWNDEWRAMNPLLADIPFAPPFPFKLIQSSAHPCFDVNTKEMFTVNCGRSFSTFVSQLRPLIYGFLDIIGVLKQPDKLRGVITKPIPANIGKNISASFKNFVQLLHNLLQFFNIFTNFVYLVRWDGESRLQKWRVVQPNGRAIKINQSMHQMGLTQDYVVLMDTAFKFLLEELLPPATTKKSLAVERVLRNLLDTPQLPDNNIYIVRRADLKPENKRVIARKVVIPRETAHFLVDYQNPDQKITIHIPHMCAWDPAEWMRDIDWNNNNTRSLPRLLGVIVGPMDISRLGCHVIDAESGKVVRSDLTPVNGDGMGYAKYTWGPELYAYRENLRSQRLEDIYWSCLGAWSELLTAHSIQMYGKYKYREVPVDEVCKLTQTGIKANLLRLHIAELDNLPAQQNRLSIQDAYEFEAGYFGTSPQFVPKVGDKDGSTDGYIVCVVYHDPINEGETGKEVWIFDAADLKSGPVCKLWHPQMNFGFTVHTTWMPKIARRTAKYNVPVREDYQDVVSQQPEYIQNLFNDWVYPQREY